MQHRGWPIVSKLRFPGPWLHQNWSYDPVTGVWTPNPGVGEELLSNAGFDTDLAGWADGSGAPSYIVWSASYGGSMKMMGADNYARANQSFATTNGRFYRVDLSLPVAPTVYIRAYLSAVAFGDADLLLLPATEVGAKIGVFRATTALSYLQLYTGWDNNYVDSCSVKPVTVADMYAVRNYGKQVGFKAQLTMTSNLPGGVVARFSDYNNKVECWHDGTNLHLDAVVAGTPTSLINTAAAYVAGAWIEIRLSGNTAQAFYDDAQVGADQDVSAVPAGTWAGLFGTDAAVQLSSPTAIP